jgi:hypothetical protein
MGGERRVDLRKEKGYRKLLPAMMQNAKRLVRMTTFLGVSKIMTLIGADTHADAKDSPRVERPRTSRPQTLNDTCHKTGSGRVTRNALQNQSRTLVESQKIDPGRYLDGPSESIRKVLQAP